MELKSIDNDIELSTYEKALNSMKCILDKKSNEVVFKKRK
jgi:hypothetical protein